MPDFPPIYVDESLSQVCLPEALRQCGLVVFKVTDKFTLFKVTDKFTRGVKDPEWLPVAGRNGWVVLTKDTAIRHRPNEMMALVNSGVRAFVLAAGEMTGPDQAALFVRTLARMIRYVETRPAPFIVRVAKDGSCEVLHPES